MIDRQADEDTGEGSGDHSDEIAEVEVGAVTVQVSAEAVLDSCSNKPGEKIR